MDDQATRDAEETGRTREAQTSPLACRPLDAGRQVAALVVGEGHRRYRLGGMVPAHQQVGEALRVASLANVALAPLLLGRWKGP